MICDNIKVIVLLVSGEVQQGPDSERLSVVWTASNFGEFVISISNWGERVVPHLY